MAKINFPNPASEQTYVAGGITWTWNDTLKVWSTAAGDEYLSKTGDDTAAGAITFEGLTTHEAGVNTTNVKGLSRDTNIDFSNASSSLRVTNDGWTAVIGSGSQARNLNVTWSSTEVLDSSFTNAYNISSILQNPVSPTADVTSFWATANNQNTSGIVAAFRTGVSADANAGTGSAYAFYAGSSAPSYFGGDTIISSQGPGVATRTAGVRIGNGGATTFYRGGSATDNPVTIKRTNSGSTGTWRAIKFENHDASAGSFIKVNGDIQKITRSDASSVPMPDGAATIIQALQPKLITEGDETSSGFLYPDLAGTYSEATDSEEEGVCRERLIPLLTKALQEALDKIETLETRLNDAGIA